MEFTPSHSRSKSYAYGVTAPSSVPPPPTDDDTLPVDYYHIPPFPLYRRPVRKKSSQILIEPIGAPKTNYMPVSPTIAVPPALQTIFDNGPAMNNEGLKSPLRRNFQYPPLPVQNNGTYTEQGQYDLPIDLSIDTSLAKRHSNTYTRGCLTPTDLPASRALRTHRRSHTVAHRASDEAAGFLADHDLVRRHSIIRESSSENTEFSLGRTPSTSTMSIDTKVSGMASSDCSTLVTPSIAVSEHSLNIPSGPEATVLVKTAGMFVFGQTVSQLLSISLNHLVLQRLVSPHVFGAAAQLEVTMALVLYFAREAIRLASQRQTLAGKQPDLYRFEGGVVENTVSGTIQMNVNIGFLPLVIGVPLLGIASYRCVYWNSWTTMLHVDSRSMALAVLVYAVSSLIELFSEPAFLLMQLKMQYRKRVAFESLASLARCLLTFAFITLGRHQQNAYIIAFALGQLGYSLVLVTCYNYAGLKDAQMSQFELTVPQRIWTDTNPSTKFYFDRETKTLARAIWLQSVLKQVLLESDKYIASMLLPAEDKSAHVLIAFWGKLVTQLVFAPVQDAVRNFYSKLLNGHLVPVDMERSVTVLSTMLRLCVYLLVYIGFFAPMACRYGKAWLDVDSSLVMVSACYLPFLAVNGLLESVFQSVALPRDIKRQSTVLLGFSVTFAVCLYVLTGLLGLGVRGLVFASMFNMAQRIGWSLVWIEEYYRQRRNEMPAVEVEPEPEEVSVPEEIDPLESPVNEEAKGEPVEVVEVEAVPVQEVKVSLFSRLFRRKQKPATSKNKSDKPEEGPEPDAAVSTADGNSKTEATTARTTGSSSLRHERSSSSESSSQVGVKTVVVLGAPPRHRRAVSGPAPSTGGVNTGNEDLAKEQQGMSVKKKQQHQHQQQVYMKPWGWLVASMPPPLVFGAVASLAPTAWLLASSGEHEDNAKVLLAQQGCVFVVLSASICACEWPILKQAFGRPRVEVEVGVSGGPKTKALA